MRASLLLLLLLGACYRKDPVYCDEATPCRAGLTCLMPQHACVAGDADLAGPADLRDQPDLRDPADLVTPAECTTAGQCPAARPVCSAGRCQPCRRNFECPDGACDDSGACHDRNRVLVVDDTAGTCRRTGEAGPRPYCYLAEALKDRDAGLSKDVILLRPSTRGGHRLDGSFLNLRFSIRLVGARAGRADPPVLVREPFDLRGGAAVAIGIDDIAIGSLDSGGVNAVYCGDNVSLTMRWSRLEGAPAHGLYTEGCVVRLLSDQILRNATLPLAAVSGVRQIGGELTMYDTIVADNGSGSFGGGVVLVGLQRATLGFNTITANRCTVPLQGCNLACDPAQPAQVSYSILSGVDPGRLATSGNCQVSTSVVPAGFPGGSGNLVGFAPVFANPAQGDYHLSLTDPANKMLRLPEPSPAVTHDIDDDPRPAGAVDVGADQRP